MMSLKPAYQVNTAELTAVGLIGGWITARETGIRPLGGVVLAAAGALATRTWVQRNGAPTAAALLGVYLVGFGGSHPLAKKIGAWPSVLTVAAVSSGAAWAVSDRRG